MSWNKEAFEYLRNPCIATAGVHSINSELTYIWLHIPSGEQGERTTKEFYCVADMLKTLDWWNRQQPLVWKYWWKPCL